MAAMAAGSSASSAFSCGSSSSRRLLQHRQGTRDAAAPPSATCSSSSSSSNSSRRQLLEPLEVDRCGGQQAHLLASRRCRPPICAAAAGSFPGSIDDWQTWENGSRGTEDRTRSFEAQNAAAAERKVQPLGSSGVFEQLDGNVEVAAREQPADTPVMTAGRGDRDGDGLAAIEQPEDILFGSLRRGWEGLRWRQKLRRRRRLKGSLENNLEALTVKDPTLLQTVFWRFGRWLYNDWLAQVSATAIASTNSPRQSSLTLWGSLQSWHQGLLSHHLLLVVTSQCTWRFKLTTWKFLPFRKHVDEVDVLVCTNISRSTFKLQNGAPSEVGCRTTLHYARRWHWTYRASLGLTAVGRASSVNRQAVYTIPNDSSLAILLALRPWLTTAPSHLHVVASAAGHKWHRAPST